MQAGIVEAVLSQNTKTQYFVSQNTKTQYFVSQNTKTQYLLSQKMSFPCGDPKNEIFA